MWFCQWQCPKRWFLEILVKLLSYTVGIAVLPLWNDYYKCIAMMYPQNVNLFVFISSLGFQRRDAFIRFQKFPKKTRQTDIKSQKSRGQPDRQTNGHTILSLRGFVHVAYGRMRCTQLQAAGMNFYCRFKAIFQTKIPIQFLYI